jgi:hypothetical protein
VFKVVKLKFNSGPVGDFVSKVIYLVLWFQLIQSEDNFLSKIRSKLMAKFLLLVCFEVNYLNSTF